MKMKYIVLEEFINNCPTKVDLDFGVNACIVLRSVDISKRMHAGNEIRRNTYMTFSQVNPVTRKTIKEHEYSFFNLTHDSPYVSQNMEGKLTKLVSILMAMGFDGASSEATMEEYLEKYGVTVATMDDLVKTVKGAANIDAALSEGFYNIVKEKVGVEGPLLNFKTTIDKKGYLEIPLYGAFVEPHVLGEDPTLKVTVKEVTAKREAEETKIAGADKLGKAPKLGGGAKGGLKNLGGF